MEMEQPTIPASPTQEGGTPRAASEEDTLVLLSLERAAEVIGISRQSVWKAVRKRRLNAIRRIGKGGKRRGWLIPEKDALRFRREKVLAESIGSEKMRVT